MEQRSFSVKEALHFGWNITTKHLGYFVLVMIILFGVTAVFGFFDEMLEDGFLSGIIGILNFLVQVVVGISLVKIVLEFLDGNPKPSWSEVTKSFSVFWKYLGGTILSSIIIIVGLFFLIIPGIYFALRYQFVSYLIVDQGLSPVNALKKSSEMTKGIKLDLLWLGIVLFAVNLLGALVVFVGLLITIPVTMVAMGYVYRKVLGQTPMMPTKPQANIGEAVSVHPGEDLLESPEDEDLLK